MQNRLVIVRDYAAKPRLARVCEDLGEIVTVRDTRVPLRSKNPDITIISIGFLRGDVFRYDREVLKTGNWEIALPF